MKMVNRKKGKSYVVFCKTLNDKKGWLAEFERERELVKEAARLGRNRRKKGHAGISRTSSQTRWLKASRKKKAESQISLDEALEAAGDLENSKVPPAETRIAISADSLRYASKIVHIGPDGYSAVVQKVLDAFLLSDLDSSMFALVQQFETPAGVSHFELPKSGPPLFGLETKLAQPPYLLYLKYLG